jgi:hypothetical protein
VTHTYFGVWRKGIAAEENTFGKSTLESSSSLGCNMGDRIRNMEYISGTIRRYALISTTKFLEGGEVVTPSIFACFLREHDKEIREFRLFRNRLDLRDFEEIIFEREFT